MLLFAYAINLGLIALGFYVLYRVVKAAMKAAIKESFEELQPTRLGHCSPQGDD